MRRKFAKNDHWVDLAGQISYETASVANSPIDINDYSALTRG
jgi:hypothetical protein